MDRKYVEMVLSEYRLGEENVCSIFKQKSFSKTLDLIYSLPDADFNIVFSQAKKFNRRPVLQDPWLNKNGLHVFRVVLSEAIYERESKEYYINPYIVEFCENGIVRIPNIFNSKELKRISKSFYSLIGIQEPGRFNNWKNSYLKLSRADAVLYSVFENPYLSTLFEMANAREDYIYHDKRAERLIHRNKDIQKQVHQDTFHPTMKFWLYMSDITKEQGPTMYVKGSNKNTLERLEWEHRLAADAHESGNKGIREGSFRISEREIKGLGYEAGLIQEPVDGNTLVIVNTRGFHARGEAEEGQVRDSITGIFRMNPFWGGENV